MISSATTRGITALQQAPRILLVDDLPENLRLLSEVFENEQLEVSFAKNGIRAAKLAELSRFEIAVLDINLPDIDGFELASRIKAVQPECEIIFCSALNDRQSRDQGFLLGAIDFIEKPYDIELTRTRMRLHIDRILLRRRIEIEHHRMNAMIASLYDAVISVNDHDQIITWNRAATRIFGLSEQEAIGKPISLFLPEELTERSLAEFVQRNGEAGEESLSRMIEMVDRQGRRFMADISISEWVEPSGRFRTAVIRDISPLKNAILRAEIYLDLITQSDLPYALVDDDGTINEHSAHFARLFPSKDQRQHIASTALGDYFTRIQAGESEISLSGEPSLRLRSSRHQGVSGNEYLLVVSSPL